ncbi:MAG: serine hydrolase domain-containing protein [Pseudomonadales bacterium]|nr:serine hydrolase domain-containing protein [Pseudomonadales bacterium]
MSTTIFRKTFSSAILLGALLALLPAAYAQIDQRRLDAITADLQSRIDAGRLSGVVAMIAKDGEIVLHTALGYQNIEDQVPMNRDTIFRIFSMTKPIAGTALMMLFDEGRFQLDDPVEQYLPELAGLQVFVSRNPDGSFVTEPAAHPMTIRELMSHTGGLVYIPPLSRGPVPDAYVEAGILNRDTPLAAMTAALGKLPLNHQPGSQWVYSVSVDVQGYLVEVLSGQSFDVFLQERLFAPLGMKDTAFYVDAQKAERLARQYAPLPTGGLQRTDNGDFLHKPAFFSGGGGLTSTAADYMKFAQMHLNKGELDGVRILSENAVNIMRSNQLPDHIDAISPLYPGNVFGVDFAIVDDPAVFNGAPKGTHWWWGIAGSWFWIDPVENIVFVGMIQNDDILYSLQVHSAMRTLLYQPLP